MDSLSHTHSRSTNETASSWNDKLLCPWQRWANKNVLKSKLSASFASHIRSFWGRVEAEIPPGWKAFANKRHNTNGIIKFICAENGQFLPKRTWYQNWYWQKGYNDKCYENRLFIILDSSSSPSRLLCCFGCRSQYFIFGFAVFKLCSRELISLHSRRA